MSRLRAVDAVPTIWRLNGAVSRSVVFSTGSACIVVARAVSCKMVRSNLVTAQAAPWFREEFACPHTFTFDYEPIAYGRIRVFRRTEQNEQVRDCLEWSSAVDGFKPAWIARVGRMESFSICRISCSLEGSR